MAMSANWVHTRYGMRAAVEQKQNIIDTKFNPNPPEKQKLVYDVTDTGSFVTS